jgi:DNA-binding FadR family transcriptional regulator
MSDGPSQIQPVKNRNLKRKHLVDLVITELHGLLDSGQYKEGDRFPTEPELCEMLNVSRTTVREAVKVLAKIGHLEVHQGKGTFVNQYRPDREPLGLRLNRASLQEVSEVRHLLELGIVRLAAERRTDGDLKILRELLEERIEAKQRGDFKACVEYDIEFHKAMAGACKNKILEEIFTTFTDALRNAIHQMKANAIDLNYEEILDAHKKLYAAVEAQDVESAIANATSYLDEIERKIKGPT